MEEIIAIFIAAVLSWVNFVLIDIWMGLPEAPGVKGAGAIGKLCRVWASFLYESKYWRDNFVFLTLSAYVDKNYKSYPKITPELAVKRGICHREDFKTPLKQTIIDIEREALKNGKGLVLLSGDVGKMGISLKCVDVVCLMTDTKDADDIIQKMYRALTDDPPSKKNGFIIDLNIKRIITAMFDYAIEKVRRNPESTSVDTTARMNNLFELCNWGQDAFIEAAKSLGINVSQENLGEIISREPLKNVLEPLDPNSGVVRFKGDTEATTDMSVDQARAVVDSNAKAAMKRRS